jgi:peroxiredoxin
MADLSDQEKIGLMALDFSLPASNGMEIKLTDYRDKTNVVLFFVREYI